MKHWTHLELAFLAAYIFCFVVGIYDLFIWRP